jgi:hypothetical protein
MRKFIRKVSEQKMRERELITMIRQLWRKTDEIIDRAQLERGKLSFKPNGIRERAARNAKRIQP